MTGAGSARWLVFDYGEVICAPTDALPGMSARLGVPVAEFESAYWAHRDDYDRGATDLDYWQAVGSAVGVDVDRATADELTQLDITGWSRLDPETVELLDACAQAGSSLALLSNAPVSFAQFAERQPWARRFRERVFSGNVGMAKPDAEIFELLVTKLGVDPHDCLFLDDRPVNVDGARAAGLRAELWQGAQHARTLL